MQTTKILMTAIAIVFSTALPAFAEDKAKEPDGVIISPKALFKKMQEQDQSKCTKVCKDGTKVMPDQKCPEELIPAPAPTPAKKTAALTCPDPDKTPYEKGKKWEMCPKKPCPEGSTTKETLVGWQCQAKGKAEPKVHVTVTCDGTCNVLEGGAPGVVTFTRDGSTKDDLSVSISVSGSANNGADYSAIPKKVLIPSGSFVSTFSVIPTDDAVFKDVRTVSIEVESGKGYEPGTPAAATLTITDNDKAPTPPPPPAPIVIPVPRDGRDGRDAPVQPAAPPDKKTEPAASTLDLGEWHVFGGPSASAVGEFPIIRPNSGQMIEAPARLGLGLELGGGHQGTEWIIDFLVRGSPLVMEWAQDDQLAWSTQPSLMLASELGVQRRFSDSFAAGLAFGGLYQAVNLDYATGNSWISSFAPTVGPRATWRVAAFDPVQLDLVLDGFVGWDTQYGYKPDNKTLEFWGTPVVGLSISFELSTIGPPVAKAKGPEAHFDEPKPVN